MFTFIIYLIAPYMGSCLQLNELIQLPIVGDIKEVFYPMDSSSKEGVKGSKDPFGYLDIT